MNRLLAVTDQRDGFPAYYPSLFGMVHLRPGAHSHSTVSQGLQGVAKLYTFAVLSGHDLEYRITSRQFLTDRELDHFVRFMYMGSLDERPLDAKGKRRARSCANQTVALRLSQVVTYLNWYVGLVCRRCWPPEEYDSALEEAQDFLGRLACRKPLPDGGEPDRVGLTPSQINALVAVLHRLADAVDNADEPTAFRMDRMLLWFDYLLEFGLRIGELLGIRLDDLDLDGEEASVSIVRRPDAADDTRADDARVKGFSRKLPLSPYLAKRTSDHLDKFRLSRPLAGSHGFLFVSTLGNPWSRSSVNRMFLRLREEEEVLGASFSCHVMRHTWNDTFTDDAIAEGLTEAEASDLRSFFMGWFDRRSERFYLRGRRRKQARAISLRSQERLRALQAAASRG